MQRLILGVITFLACMPLAGQPQREDAAILKVSASGVEFAAPFTDGCVLQRGVPVAVWGRAESGEKVEVTFCDQRVGTTAGVRYLHCPPFTGNIFNEMNLPLGVFRIDR